MSHFLPPPILAFFQTPVIENKPAVERKTPIPYTGVSQFLHRLKNDLQPPTKGLTIEEQKLVARKEKEEKHKTLLAEKIANWKPLERTNGTKSAYKTLFVGRLAYDITEDDLYDEFEHYGPVTDVKLVRTPEGKSRGYAFIEFDSDKDLKKAFLEADGKKIRGRRIVVDVERGRTVKTWIPRKFGGGLGGTTRLGGKDKNQRVSGRAVLSSDSRRSRSRSRDRRKKSRSRSRRRSRSRDRYRRSSRERDHRSTRDHSTRDHRDHRDRGDHGARDKYSSRDHERDHRRR